MRDSDSELVCEGSLDDVGGLFEDEDAEGGDGEGSLGAEASTGRFTLFRGRPSVPESGPSDGMLLGSGSRSSAVSCAMGNGSADKSITGGVRLRRRNKPPRTNRTRNTAAPRTAPTITPVFDEPVLVALLFDVPALLLGLELRVGLACVVPSS
jgi:hypothetical protein